MDQEAREAAEAVATDSTAVVPNGDGPHEPTDEERAEQIPVDRDRSSLFEHSQFVHVGPGAESCPDRENGGCNNELHFHAWIRLPNPFQSEEIRKKATAAKARRLRQLRDEESDGRVVIEAELEELVARDDRESLIDAIVNKEFLNDHLRAMQDVADEDEYKTIEDDRERLRALDAMDPEDRPDEEYEELRKHVASYTQKVNEKRAELQAPVRESVQDRPIEELASLVREDRIQADAQQAFNATYSKWEWYVCTMKIRVPDKLEATSERYFQSVDHLVAAAPEIYEALDHHFTNLEAAAGRQLKGS